MSGGAASGASGSGTDRQDPCSSILAKGQANAYIRRGPTHRLYARFPILGNKISAGSKHKDVQVAQLGEAGQAAGELRDVIKVKRCQIDQRCQRRVAVTGKGRLLEPQRLQAGQRGQLQQGGRLEVVMDA